MLDTILLIICAIASVTCATVMVLFYLRLRDVNLPRVRFEIGQLWKKRNRPRQGRPMGV